MNRELQERMDKIVAEWEKEQGTQVLQLKDGMVNYQRHWLDWIAWCLVRKN